MPVVFTLTAAAAASLVFFATTGFTFTAPETLLVMGFLSIGGDMTMVVSGDGSNFRLLETCTCM